jgi:hypothetical protein
MALHSTQLEWIVNLSWFGGDNKCKNKCFGRQNSSKAATVRWSLVKIQVEFKYVYRLWQCKLEGTPSGLKLMECFTITET